MLRRTLITVLAAGLILLASVTSFTGAQFSARTDNAGNVLRADATANYVHAYSQSTNPGGLGAYAIRRGSSTSVPAATGSDDGLAVNLGGYRNVNDTTVGRVFTVTTPSALPEGVTSVTVTLTTVADPSTGAQPIKAATLATTGNVSLGSTTSLPTAVTVQVNLTVNTKSLTLSRQYAPRVIVKATYGGYSGGFLAYVLPIKVYNGTGAGPD